MAKLTVRDVDVAGRKVLVRVDFNVPLDAGGQITDDTRIVASLPTIQYLLENGAAVILMSHLGRPKEGPDPKLSLAPTAARLQELLGSSATVRFAGDCVGDEVKQAARHLQPGEVLLLENVRFHKEEEANDSDFAGQLASLADLYVNDAFGSAHRAHASTEGVAHILPAYSGLLMEREINIMGKALEDPERPFVAILGGAKVSDKMGVIGNLLNKVDVLVIGGGMANTFLKAIGIPIGQSLVENDRVRDAEALNGRANLQNVRLMLPRDAVIASEMSATAHASTVDLHDLPPDIDQQGWRILDIGPETAAEYATAIREARTIVWNGPMGVFEIPAFAAGTLAVAQAVCDATREGATSIVGGGDSVAAIEQVGLADCITHVSTGGGASLEFLEGQTLPGVAALRDA
ncbi:MAG: phosphoglycerate kinase [Chloroflexota bacterium]|nr:phosphoglycerate kinase [Chloroflexota bacterium]MDQ5864389.1 phosphoglycerate kinase [Chloroflexota bacterium]